MEAMLTSHLSRTRPKRPSYIPAPLSFPRSTEPTPSTSELSGALARTISPAAVATIRAMNEYEESRIDFEQLLNDVEPDSRGDDRKRKNGMYDLGLGAAMLNDESMAFNLIDDDDDDYLLGKQDNTLMESNFSIDNGAERLVQRKEGRAESTWVEFETERTSKESTPVENQLVVSAVASARAVEAPLQQVSATKRRLSISNVALPSLGLVDPTLSQPEQVDIRTDTEAVSRPIKVAKVSEPVAEPSSSSTKENRRTSFSRPKHILPRHHPAHPRIIKAPTTEVESTPSEPVRQLQKPIPVPPITQPESTVLPLGDFLTPLIEETEEEEDSSLISGSFNNSLPTPHHQQQRRTLLFLDSPNEPSIHPVLDEEDSLPKIGVPLDLLRLKGVGGKGRVTSTPARPRASIAAMNQIKRIAPTSIESAPEMIQAIAGPIIMQVPTRVRSLSPVIEKDITVSRATLPPPPPVVKESFSHPVNKRRASRAFDFVASSDLVSNHASTSALNDVYREAPKKLDSVSKPSVTAALRQSLQSISRPSDKLQSREVIPQTHDQFVQHQSRQSTIAPVAPRPPPPPPPTALTTLMTNLTKSQRRASRTLPSDPAPISSSKNPPKTTLKLNYDYTREKRIVDSAISGVDHRLETTTTIRLFDPILPFLSTTKSESMIKGGKESMMKATIKKCGGPIKFGDLTVPMEIGFGSRAEERQRLRNERIQNRGIVSSFQDGRKRPMIGDENDLAPREREGKKMKFGPSGLEGGRRLTKDNLRPVEEGRRTVQEASEELSRKVGVYLNGLNDQSRNVLDSVNHTNRQPVVPSRRFNFSITRPRGSIRPVVAPTMTEAEEEVSFALEKAANLDRLGWSERQKMREEEVRKRKEQMRRDEEETEKLKLKALRDSLLRVKPAAELGQGSKRAIVGRR